MRLACLWSGGKDSNLALYKAISAGHEIACLATITFDGKRFRAHPQKLLPLQAEALGIKYLHFNANKPYLQDYRKVVKTLIKDYGIEGLLTGDLWLQSSLDWTKKVCRPFKNTKLLTPLWKMNTAKLLSELVSKNFKPMITCIMKQHLPGRWVGRTITKSNLKAFKSDCRKTNADFCGENGEYHSVVLDAPHYKKKIKIEKFALKNWKQYCYLKPEETRLVGK